jgi:hypothetical protein
VLPSMTGPSSATGAGLVPKRPDRKAMPISLSWANPRLPRLSC